MRLADKKERFLSNRPGLFQGVRLFVKRNPPHPPICPHLVIINQQYIQANTLGKLFFGSTKGLLKALTGFGLCRVEKWKIMKSHCVKVTCSLPGFKKLSLACIQICIFVGGLQPIAGTTQTTLSLKLRPATKVGCVSLISAHTRALMHSQCHLGP